MRERHKIGVKGWLAVMLATGCIAFGSNILAQSVSDTQVKALYIYKITKFLTWKGASKQPIRFCYMESSSTSEEESVGQQLSNYLAKKGKRDVSVMHLRNLQELDSCDILYIPASEQSALETVLTKTSGKDILTISDAKRFIYRDGMLGFITDEENRVQMEANLKNINATNIKVSAAALEVMAEVVR
jgi:hypothetical protein